jgi:hypothetical protein
MKSSRLILAMLLGASAWAQTLPLKQQVNTPGTARPTAVRTASPSALLGKPPAPVAATKAAPVVSRSANWQPVSAPAASPSNKRHGRKADQPFFTKTALAAGGRPAPIAHKGRRDPFVSPVVDRVRATASCVGSGKKCLAIGEISLHGVVHSSSGFIAVVMNGEHTYFLRENDPLADGSVVRINKDAIILREYSSDMLGRPLTREVTKKLGVPSV